MPRPIDHAKRADMLAAVVAYLATEGLGDLSLRPLAAALGTSSRMLVHYFGTKEDLLIAALATQRPDIARHLADADDLPTIRARLLDLFETSVSGTGTVSVRVLLQVLGSACAEHGPFHDYARATIAIFIDALTAALRRAGRPDPEITATALISGLRGIIQDELLTTESPRTRPAAQHLIDALLPA